MFNFIPLTWKLAGIALILTALLGVGWGIHHHIWNQGHSAGVIDGIQQSQEQCNKDKAITKEVSSAYQKKISALNSKLNALRVSPPKCIAVKPNTPIGRNDAAPGEELRGQNGLPSGVLYEFAGDAEKSRLQLIACQDFINRSMEVK